MIPKVDNTNVDRSVATIHATVLACLRHTSQVSLHLPLSLLLFLSSQLFLLVLLLLLLLLLLLSSSHFAMVDVTMLACLRHTCRVTFPLPLSLGLFYS